MSVRRIPITSKSSKFQQVTTLDGETYTLRFRWNERSNHWFLTIRDAAGSDLVTGRKVVADVPFGAHETIDGFPPGSIWVRALGGTEEDPGLRDLGNRVIMMYVDEANVA